VAKKWQELEFVDYKERQRRRRIKKRQAEQEQFTEKTAARSNFTIAGIFLTLFLFVSLGSVMVIMSQREKDEDARSKMFISMVSFTGTAQEREDATVDWTPVKPGTQRFIKHQFRTQPNSTLNLETFDRVIIRLLGQSELFLTGMEIFNQNQGSKSNLFVEAGDVVFDSRGSDGLLEIKVLDSTVYARPSLFKVIRKPNGADIRVSAGAVRFERGERSVILQTGETISIVNGTLLEVTKFNPLTETW